MAGLEESGGVDVEVCAPLQNLTGEFAEGREARRGGGRQVVVNLTI